MSVCLCVCVCVCEERERKEEEKSEKEECDSEIVAGGAPRSMRESKSGVVHTHQSQLLPDFLWRRCPAATPSLSGAGQPTSRLEMYIALGFCGGDQSSGAVRKSRWTSWADRP